MTYTQTHLYLTWHWTVSGIGEEEGQCGLRFLLGMGAADQARVDAAAPAVQTFWASAGAGIENGFKLTYLRLASIGADGKYSPGTISYDHVYPAAIGGGGGTTTARYPMQTALAATLTTAVPRGRASKGRIYLPWLNFALGSDGRFPLTAVNARSTALATCIDALQVDMGTPAVMSKIGTGTTNAITGVQHGTRPDVQRRRAKSMTENYGSVIPI